MFKSIFLFLFPVFTLVDGFSHTGYEIKLKCPVDNQAFISKGTASYTSFGAFKDFQKYGAIGSLYEDYIHCCPKCHYCGYKNDFDTIFTQDQITSILQVLSPYKTLQVDQAMENDIAAILYIHFNRKNDAIGNLYLIGSYLLKDNIDKQDTRKSYQNKAVLFFIKALENKEYTRKDNYASINYLIAELYRRIGQFDMAVQYFNLAIQDKNKASWLKEIANEQKILAQKKDDSNDI